MASQFDLTRFYDIIIQNSVFQIVFLTWEFYIPYNKDNNSVAPSKYKGKS